MKRLVALLLALVMCLPLCACGGSAGAKNTHSSTSSGKFELNDKGRIIWAAKFLEDKSNVEMLEEKLEKSIILWKMNSAAASRAEAYAGENKWKTFDSFTSYKVTSMKLIEGNSVVEICGELLGKTQSGKAATTTFRVEAYFVENEEQASGYSVEFTSWSMGELS